MAPPFVENQGHHVYENDYTRMWIENRILYITYAKDLNVTIGIAKLCVKERIQFTKNLSFPVLSDTTNIKSFDKEARAYLSTPEAIVCLKAGAFITPSHFQKVFMNFFLLINRPPIPTMLFTDKKKAFNWLQAYV